MLGRRKIQSEKEAIRRKQEAMRPAEPAKKAKKEAEEAPVSAAAIPINERLGRVSSALIEEELRRERYRKRYGRVLRSTIYTLLVVAAVAVLTAMLWLPVLQIYGTSMSPTLNEGSLVLSLKGSSFQTSDIIAFYYNNRILVKRVIAQPGEWVNITEDGTVYVNDVEVDEPYLVEKALGDCDIEMPYQVPEGRVFVMGDHRSVSADSRNSAIGCIADDQIVGKLFMCIWPMEQLQFFE